MNIDIEPIYNEGKHKFQLKINGKKVLPLIGKTGLRIRINELITEL